MGLWCVWFVECASLNSTCGDCISKSYVSISFQVAVDWIYHCWSFMHKTTVWTVNLFSNNINKIATYPEVTWQWISGNARPRFRDITLRLLQCTVCRVAKDDHRQAAMSVQHHCPCCQWHTEVWLWSVRITPRWATLAGRARKNYLQAGHHGVSLFARSSVKHLGTLLTISLQPLMSLPGSVSVLQTDNNFSFPAADLTRTAVGLSRLLVQLSGTRYLEVISRIFPGRC